MRSLLFAVVLGTAHLLVAQCDPAPSSPAPSNSAAADFPQIARYRADNLQRLQSGTKPSVVFLGDSITDYWGSRNGTWFPYHGWVNRGIGGQTTAQLLLREQDDAIALHPSAIVLEGAGNDMRLGFSPTEIRDRLRSMGELAAAHGIQVFLQTMTPVCDCFRPLTGLRTPERIQQLNTMLATLARKRGWGLIDVYPVLADETGHMRKEWTVDGVHPNDEGYRRMTPVVEKALRKYWKR